MRMAPAKRRCERVTWLLSRRRRLRSRKGRGRAFGLAGRRQRHCQHIGPAERDHDPRLAAVERIDGVDAVARGEHTVEGGRRSAALDVAEDVMPRLVSGARLDLASSQAAMPPSRTWPNGVDVAGCGRRASPSRGWRPRRRRRSRTPPARVAVAQVLADLVDVERPLGHEDRVGAAGDTRVRRDPAGMAAHHLDDEDAVVRLGGRVQAVDRVGRDLDGGVEAERVVGAVEVVVDRLRHADDRHAVARRACRRRRACPRRRSGSARRRRRAPSPRARAPCRPRRPCRGSCARCRGSCRRAAGCPSSPRASARSRCLRARRPSRSESR